MTPTPEEIRAEIENTQQELGDTVEALARKTDVKAQATARAEAVRESIHGTVHDAQQSAAQARDEAAERLRAVTPQSARAGADRAFATVRARPLPAVGAAAFLAGVLVGHLLARR